MQQYSNLFLKHDRDRFFKYLEKVAGSHTTISGATLLPHTLVYKALRGTTLNLNKYQSARIPDEAQLAFQAERNLMEAKVVDSQWETLVRSILEEGGTQRKLSRCISVCDVSGSMTCSLNETAPIYPALALSLLLSRITEAPFGNNIITFSNEPSLVEFDPRDGLVNNCSKLQRISWDMNTDLNKVFELILKMARDGKVPPESMEGFTIFVFSDMQFDEATCRNKTNHHSIKQMYQEAGYPMPHICYWNLSGYPSKPVESTEENTSLMSGFSGTMMKIFLRGEEEPEVEPEVEPESAASESLAVEEKKTTMEPSPALQKKNPVDVMNRILSDATFDCLKVID